MLWSIGNELVPSPHTHGTCMIAYEAANTKHETYKVRAIRIIISLTGTFVYISLLFTIIDEHLVWEDQLTETLLFSYNIFLLYCWKKAAVLLHVFSDY